MPPSSVFLAMILQSQQSQRVSSLTGNIERIEGFESKALNTKRNITVYLPPSYKTDLKAKYPVIYMHDGQNVFDGKTSYIPNQEWRADEAAESLIEAAIIEPLIIVAIDNGGTERGNEYLPTKIKMGNNEMGGKADLYGKMLIDEIMPIVNDRYRTKMGPENTGLIGSSFGGVITCYLGSSRPDVFGRLGILSPSVWVDDKVLLTIVKPPAKKARKPRVWMDMGGKEGADSIKDVRSLYDVYVKQGWKPKSEVLCMVEQNAEHNEIAWARRLPSILTYLFPKK